MGIAIAVVSGKGGTGKTTTVGAVASCLASRGHKTLCIDCDVGLKNLDISLGLTGETTLDFLDVLNKNALLEEAAVEHPEIGNLFFLSAPTTVSPENIDAGAMAELISEAKEKFEYCFIDAPAGIGPGFRLAVAGADCAVVVAAGDTPSMRDGQRTVAELGRLGINNVRLVVNRLKPQLFRVTGTTMDNMIDAIGARLLGIVEEDDSVSLAASFETPLILCDSTPAMREFNRISLRLEGYDVPLKFK